MAMQTAIMRGAEVVILTRDADFQEQYFKLMCHIKEHYRCVLVADQYAMNPDSMAFHPVLLKDEKTHASYFEDEAILICQTTENELNVLPASYQPVDISCVLLAGGNNDLGMTFNVFRAEAEMVRLLRLKHGTGGLNTDRLAGKNCYVETSPFKPDGCRVTIFVGNEKRQKFGPAEFSMADWNNSLFCNEQMTKHQQAEK